MTMTRYNKGQFAYESPTPLMARADGYAEYEVKKKC